MNAENTDPDQIDQRFETDGARLLSDDSRNQSVGDTAGNDFDQGRVVAAVKRKINENELGP